MNAQFAKEIKMSGSCGDTLHTPSFIAHIDMPSTALHIVLPTTAPCAPRPADCRGGLLSPPAPGRTPEQHPAPAHPQKNLPTQHPHYHKQTYHIRGSPAPKKIVKTNWQSLTAQIFMKQRKPVCIYSWKKQIANARSVVEDEISQGGTGTGSS